MAEQPQGTSPGEELVTAPPEESCPYPTTTIKLPSRGLFYDGRLPEGTVLLRPMTTREEKLLISPKKERLALLDIVLARCLVTKDVPLADMLIGDRFFLLLSLRSITYGTNYQFQTRCRGCNTEDLMRLSIPEGLEIRVLEPTDSEPFKVLLPVSQKTLGLRLLRVKDETDIQRWAKQCVMKPVPGEEDSTYEYRLARHIVTIDGAEPDILAATGFCSNMLGGDSLAMRSAIDDMSPGARLQLHHVCSCCGNSYDRTMPFTASFFRPGAESGLE